MVEISDHCYRYELWRTDTRTLVYSRLSTKLLDINESDVLDSAAIAEYPNGYEWHVYRDRCQIGCWTIEAPAATSNP